jgi:hypothetical protein
MNMAWFRSNNPVVRMLALVVSIVVFGIAWYLISPLFVDARVSEGFPTLGYMPTRTTDPIRAASTEAAAAMSTQTALALGFDVGEATAMMEAAMTAEPELSDEVMPAAMNDQTKIYASGNFYDVAHAGRGLATIYTLADGARVLRFEDFEVENGPDLHVYLSTQDPVENSVGVELVGAFDLGELKGNIGDQNYEIAADFDLSPYRSVVIWCQPFRVPFSAAPLQTP